MVKKINFKRKKAKNYSKIFNINLLKKFKIKAKKSFLGVSINSKKISKENLFIGIKGKNKDGNLFTNQALKKGASFCVVNRYINKPNCLKVKETKNF